LLGAAKSGIRRFKRDFQPRFLKQKHKNSRRRMSMRLKDKVVIVTGGGRGLGKAYAQRLAEEGARVAVADIIDSGDTKLSIEEKGGQVIAVVADVTNEDNVKELARQTIDRFGRVDVLINNAAIFADLSKKSFIDISVAEWDRMMSVNLRGTFLCTKAVYPQMKKQGKGKIINVSSGTFFTGVPGFLHYVTSKGGVVGFTRALAREVGNDGISVNAIAPGLTVNEAVLKSGMYPPEALKFVAGTRCFKRNEQPDDLVGTIVFLASDESDFITGQTIVVDGGAVVH
jgi:NAD(P)-dependent dehydrogenase (short-subunit alcohol dehydrogenase family)